MASDNDKDDALAALWHELGEAKAPENVTQEAFEHDTRHLRRLARLRPGERAEVGDLYEYAHDLRYAEIQSSLLRYLLPFCLEGWHKDLRGEGGYGGFVDEFYPVLADRHVFDKHLTAKETAAVSEFMRRAILEEIDDQRGLFYQGMGSRPYRWIRAGTTYGVLLTDLDRLWNAWWSLDTLGRAIAAVQYVSCLMYPEYENPVFAPWTRDKGGGPPCLWEFEGHLYTHRWQEPNVDFLKGVLNASQVSELLTRAVERLVGQPEHDVAAEVFADVPLCSMTLEARCVELPRLLGTTQEPGRLFEWST